MKWKCELMVPIERISQTWAGWYLIVMKIVWQSNPDFLRPDPVHFDIVYRNIKTALDEYHRTRSNGKTRFIAFARKMDDHIIIENHINEQDKPMIKIYKDE